ncbi:MAG: type 4a pilus biogenesis protein PilO [Pseudomonadales bacterium]|uniref:Type 4 fimbrial biogenesis protein PilO n=1 Tax=Oleiphilus messinensis TaxID=141451 RepID=A0A1Y0I3V1_9GAMM|nr:type 4a pilus biogenesis protein PilO [Oleiphilus messinensis]ARU54879.1 type 4 fimbrial biogenesis protein PilO [Oleiphilus messinensis]MCG8611085.1 type 4a pilus biogenesis protein PilO [Pseudomonadales bacterium]
MSLADSLEGLKGFDINDLDFNNAGSWPFLIKVIVFVLVFVLVIGGSYYFLVQDQYEQLDRVEIEESELRTEYEKKAFKAANLDAYRKQMAEMEASFGALLKQLPTDTEVPGLLEDITNTGVGSGLEIKAIDLQAEKKREFYVELPIKIELQGTYHDLASFVSGVAGLPRIVTLHDLSIEPPKTSNGEVLNMSIVAKTYRYKSGG